MPIENIWMVSRELGGVAGVGGVKDVTRQLLAAITRRDPTIVARIWPVAENYTAMVILDHLIAHFGYQALIKK